MLLSREQQTENPEYTGTSSEDEGYVQKKCKLSIELKTCWPLFFSIPHNSCNIFYQLTSQLP